MLERLRDERAEVEKYVEQTLSGVEGRDLSDAELRTLSDSKARITALDGQIGPLVEFLQAKDSAADLTAVLGRGARAHAQASAAGVETRSMGEAFIASDVYGTYPGRGTSSRMHYEARALPMSLTSMGSALPPKPRVDISAPPAPTPLLSLIDTVPVSGNGVETIIWAKVAGGADVVAEKAVKPSVEFAPTVASFTLDTIATWTHATRQLLEDAPAIAARIDTELRREVNRKMEAEAAAALVAATLPTATDATSLMNGIRKGVGVVQAAGYTPNGVLLNPADWATLDIDVFGNTLLGPSMRSNFWGLTPVAATSQPAGTATVGDFSSGVQRYSRSDIAIYVTDSDQDDFLKNLFKILCEVRAKTVVTRPAALVEVTKTP